LGYLLFLLLIETGIKLEELFALKVSHFDFSNKYAPEMVVKHTGKKEKKSRKLKVPIEITTVFIDRCIDRFSSHGIKCEHEKNIYSHT
jgi:integrase